MKIVNTGDPQIKPSVVMMIYGEGGVGKSTFGATAPKPLLLDFENGSKYFGLRGIKVDVININSWLDVRDQELINTIKAGKYETIIIDPLGEAMEKLKQWIISMGDRKMVQSDGSLTMAGWGYLKKSMRDYLKFLRDSGKHVLLIAHLEEKQDENRLVKRPKIETKISDDIVNMVDVVGYMTIQTEGEMKKRIIIVDPSNDKYTAKDRTEQLGRIIEPDFSKIIQACQGTKSYHWSNPAKLPKDDDKKVLTKAESMGRKLATANSK